MCKFVTKSIYTKFTAIFFFFEPGMAELGAAPRFVFGGVS